MDFFHGLSIRQPGASSGVWKLVQPFHSGALLVGAAALNVAVRAARRESAYPGLRELIRRVYSAAAGMAPAPISRADAMAVAVASDAVAERLALRAASPA